MKALVQYALMGILFVTAVTFAVIALVPGWRGSVQKMVVSDQRTVLATVYGKLVPEFEPLKIIKAIDENGVFIEIFRASEDGTLTLIKEIRTGQPHDGQFNFKGHMSRLTASDLDQDGNDEVLVPTFDEMQRPHLNVYKYEPSMNDFHEISPALPVQ